MVLVVGCTYNQDIPIKDIEQNIEDSTLQDFSMSKFITNLNIENGLRIEDFKMGITGDKKIRVMSINMVKASDSQVKRYSILFNRDNHYLKVKESTLNKGEVNTHGILEQDFSSEFDRLKDEIELPVGDYKFYNINLLIPYSITNHGEANKAVYVLDDKGIYKLGENEKVSGLNFMITGDPIKSTDVPIYYVIKE